VNPLILKTKILTKTAASGKMQLVAVMVKAKVIISKNCLVVLRL